MLISTLEVKAACRAGANLLDMQQVGQRKVETAVGPRWEPKFEYVYVQGSSLGNHTDIQAPVDVQAGDLVEVEAGDGVPLRVRRGETVVWERDLTPTPAAASPKGRGVKEKA